MPYNMRKQPVWGALALLVVMAAFALPGVATAAPAAVVPHLTLGNENPNEMAPSGSNQYLSINWAGYANFDQTNGTVTRVSGTWVMASVVCPSKGSQYMVQWVGIDGFSSSTVEQDGTFAICDHGVASYYAWWELYPTNAIQVVPSVSVTPGDSISALVVFHPHTDRFTMSVMDLTNGKSFSVTGRQAPKYAPYALENGAECIVERPATIIDDKLVFLPLANFGVTSFSKCTSTVSGQSGGVGEFAPSAIIYMVSEKSTVTHLIYMASPGGPTNLVRWSFPVTWQGYD